MLVGMNNLVKEMGKIITFVIILGFLLVLTLVIRAVCKYALGHDDWKNDRERSGHWRQNR